MGNARDGVTCHPARGTNLWTELECSFHSKYNIRIKRISQFKKRIYFESLSGNRSEFFHGIGALLQSQLALANGRGMDVDDVVNVRGITARHGDGCRNSASNEQVQHHPIPFDQSLLG